MLTYADVRWGRKKNKISFFRNIFFAEEGTCREHPATLSLDDVQMTAALCTLDAIPDGSRVV
jgi:hypothetical protein